MSHDLLLLQCLKDRETFERLLPAVPMEVLQAETKAVLKGLRAFYKEVRSYDADAFRTYMLGLKLKGTDEATRNVYATLLDAMALPPEATGQQFLLTRLREARASQMAAEAVAKYEAGEDVDIVAALTGVVDSALTAEQKLSMDPQCRDDIGDILFEEENDVGFHWRNPSMNRAIRPLRAGDFCILAASVDAGKTTWCASEVTNFAQQVDTLYPGENRSILWLNNEGMSRRIVSRTWQAATRMTMPQMVEAHKAGTLRQQYIDAIGGRGGALRVMSIHEYTTGDVERLFRAHPPAIVLFDMVDNVRFSGEVNNGGQRTDQILEALYQWARLMAVKYDAAMIATSQLSVDGFGMQFPLQHMLKDSKVGKQGAADLILTLGKVADPTYDNVRWIGAPKNKLRRASAGSLRAMVEFNADVARVEDPSADPVAA